MLFELLITELMRQKIFRYICLLIVILKRTTSQAYCHAGAPEEHHVMTKYKQSWLRLPTEYDDVKVVVSAEGPHVCCCAPALPRRLMYVFSYVSINTLS